MANTNDFWDALTDLAKEKNISMDVLIETIENSLLIACKNNYGKGKDPNGKGKEVNASVEIDRNSGEYHVYLIKTVVEDVQDSVEEISLTDAHNIDGKLQVGDVVKIEVKSKEFGRIAATAAKNTITQKIREEERNVLYKEYYELQHKVVTGVVTRFSGNNIHVNLGKLEGFLSESEQVKGEFYKIQDRIKVYIVEVKMSSKGPRIVVSRTHPELVKKLFEEEVSEVRDGIVEIKSISREAGSRTKIAVWSNDEDVDPVGACVGQNGARVNAIVNELRGEKIDIVEWDENPAYLIENALSPAKVVADRLIAEVGRDAARRLWHDIGDIGMQGLAVDGTGGDEIGVEIVGCLRVGKLGALADGDEDVVAENVVMDDVLAAFHRPVQCDVIARRCCRQADGAVAFFVFVAAGVVGNIE